MADTNERFEEAKAYYDNQVYDTAVPKLQALANEGHGGAQCYLGNAYSVGNGVAKDDAKAAEWQRKAAAQGYDWSQYSRGGAGGNAKGSAAAPLPSGMAYQLSPEEKAKIEAEARAKVEAEMRAQAATAHAAAKAKAEAETKAREQAARQVFDKRLPGTWRFGVTNGEDGTVMQIRIEGPDSAMWIATSKDGKHFEFKTDIIRWEPKVEFRVHSTVPFTFIGDMNGNGTQMNGQAIWSNGAPNAPVTLVRIQ